MKKKILIVAAHPDDEILGCGGTVARLVKEGCEACTLILGEGVTSREKVRPGERRSSELKELKNEAFRANKIIGVKRIFLYELPDNRFDTIPLLDIVKIIEKVKKEIRPDMVFTHYENDLNVDHQIAYKAVVTATRPVKEESVRKIFSFEVLSSTEWGFSQNFCPNAFFDITKTIGLKEKALGKYVSELRAFPHPRSLIGAKLLARTRGMAIGAEYAEGFKCVRTIE
jgi:LmbE family N-acetylglucosaminyl deacetylase